MTLAYYTFEQVEIITDPSKMKFPYWLINRIMYHSGFRISEVLQMRPNLLVITDGEYQFILPHQKNKRYKNQPCPLLEEDWRSIQEVISTRKIGPKERIFKISRQSCHGANKKLAIKYKIDGPNDTKGLRHSAVTWMMDSGLNPFQVSGITRHSPKMVQKIYDGKRNIRANINLTEAHKKLKENQR